MPVIGEPNCLTCDYALETMSIGVVVQRFYDLWLFLLLQPLSLGPLTICVDGVLQHLGQWFMACALFCIGHDFCIGHGCLSGRCPGSSSPPHRDFLTQSLVTGSIATRITDKFERPATVLATPGLTTTDGVHFTSVMATDQFTPISNTENLDGR